MRKNSEDEENFFSNLDDVRYDQEITNEIN